MSTGPRFRIGELARRTGVSTAVLRAWEARYDLLAPIRSAGGYRLYSGEDEARVRRMRDYQRDGLSAAEAARAAIETEDAAPSTTRVPDAARELREALERFDESEAQAVLDRTLASLTLDSVLASVVLPCLHEIGERWASEEVTVAQEHFAANLIRGRLLGLARDWGRGRGPRALLACAPGELHDLGLISFGLALRSRGWRITFLGPSTPVETLAEATATLAPELVVVSSTTTKGFRSAAQGLREVAARVPLALAGQGATAKVAEDIGGRFFGDDPVAEAERVSAGSALL